MPEALVERVEVVTGGASAAYGSDAVSGVVNFILDTDFTGLKANAQAGITEIGDNINSKFGVAFGTPIGERFHLLTSAEVYKANGVKGYTDRDWFDGWGVINNTTANINAGGPLRVTVPNARSTNYTAGGLVTGYFVPADQVTARTTGPLINTQFLKGSVPTGFTRGAYYTSTSQSGGSGSDPNATETWIMPDQLRASGFARLNFDVNDDLSLFAQGLIGHSSSRFEKDAANMSSPWEARIYRENPFLPASIGAQMDALGANAIRVGRVASSADLGGGLVDNRNNLKSGTLGFKGKLPGDWNYDGYYQYGQNTAVLYYKNTSRHRPAVSRGGRRDQPGQRPDRLPFDAQLPDRRLRADEHPRRRLAVARGHPVRQRRYVRPEPAHRAAGRRADVLRQGVRQLGRYGIGCGGRGMAQGNPPQRAASLPERTRCDHRGTHCGEPGLQGTADAVLRSGESLRAHDLSRTSVASTTSARRSSRPIFPLLRDVPLVQSLDFNGAFRWADYSGSGGIPAWKLGLDWQVLDPLRLRATVSRDVRAGTLSERFDYSGSGATVADPFLAVTEPAYTITSICGGNPTIDPEKADTLTFGFVYSPGWLPGFNLSADYYDIKIDDAIAQLTVQQIADECFRGATELCARITRNAGTGRITQINNTFLNVAEARTKGIDLEAGYTRPVEWFGGGESVGVRAFGTWISEQSQTNIGSGTIDRAGQTGLGGGAPKWQANVGVNYQRGPLSLNVQERFIGRGSYNAIYTARDIDDNVVGSVFLTNLRAGFDFGPADRQITVFANITNLFDRAPPLAPTFGFNGSNHTNEGLVRRAGPAVHGGCEYEAVTARRHERSNTEGCMSARTDSGARDAKSHVHVRSARHIHGRDARAPKSARAVCAQPCSTPRSRAPAGVTEAAVSAFRTEAPSSDRAPPPGDGAREVERGSA